MAVRIRDAEGVILAQGDPQVVLDRCNTVPVTRVDIWPRDDGLPTTVGVCWDDESFALMDWREEARARAWIQQHPGLANALREHPLPAARAAA